MMRVRDKGNVALHLSELRVLRRVQTRYHKVVIYRHPQLGGVLVLDNEIQHVEGWTHLYHEPLVHLAAAFVEEPRDALVLGGGSFFVIEELLKYKGIERVVMLDHDSQLLDVVSGVYGHAARARNDPRLEIRAIDAFRALPKISECFDLVINDSVDLMREHGPNIFATMAQVLRRHGVCSDVVYRHIFDDLYLSRTIQTLRHNFCSILAPMSIPEYPGIIHMLTVWGRSKNLNQGRKKPANNEQRAWAAAPVKNPCTFYDPRFIEYYLHLPPFIHARLKGNQFKSVSS